MEVDSQDLYSILNIPRTATTDEINTIYKVYSLRYHPDKNRGEENKQIAEEMFNKIKYARDVLCDPSRRAIYDILGHEGLRSLGREVILRTKSAEEIYEEFAYVEKLKRRKDQEDSVEPKSSTNIMIDATDIFQNDEFIQMPIKKIGMSQSISFPLNYNDRITIISQCDTLGDHKFTLLINSNSFWPGNMCNFEFSSGRNIGITGTISKQLTNSMSLFSSTGLVIYNGIAPILIGGITWRLSSSLILSTQLNISFQSAARLQLSWNFSNTDFSLACDIGRSNYTLAAKISKNISKIDSKITIQYGNITGVVALFDISKSLNHYTKITSKLSLSTVGGVSLSLRLKRGNQQISVPFQLSSSILPSSLFYGLILPPMFFGLATRLYSKFTDEKKCEDIKNQNERLKAENIMNFLKGEADKVRTSEQTQRGLVIVLALWGQVKDKYIM